MIDLERGNKRKQLSVKRALEGCRTWKCVHVFIYILYRIYILWTPKNVPFRTHEFVCFQAFGAFSCSFQLEVTLNHFAGVYRMARASGCLKAIIEVRTGNSIFSMGTIYADNAKIVPWLYRCHDDFKNIWVECVLRILTITSMEHTHRHNSTPAELIYRINTRISQLA